MKKQLIVLTALASVLASGQAALAAENVQGENYNQKTTSLIEPAAVVEYQVSWYAVSGATNYKIKMVRVDKPLDPPIVPVTDLGKETLFKAPYLKSNTQYRVWVAAYDSKGKLLAQKTEEKKTVGEIGGIIVWQFGALK
ncbi:fibronectin type III domain-containing protein [Paenibacillus chitinolyticus]|uniref:fibronectin type III domain-containing protein n=1 Tax=Paenibacillus chitinolyticus TaxID=79263 RepID=UPI00366E0CE7